MCTRTEPSACLGPTKAIGKQPLMKSMSEAAGLGQPGIAGWKITECITDSSDLCLWVTMITAIKPERKPDTARLLSLDQYDIIVVSYSGGKDSLACLLFVIETLRDLGLSDAEIAKKVELWHQCVDGEPGSEGLMDWPCTESYVEATGKAFSLPVLFQWRHGGFEREMLKNNEQSQPISFDDGNGGVTTKDCSRSSVATRMKFPMPSGDLRVRWCSASLKIDVAARAISNSERFKKGTFLMVTGERREESTNRSKYAEVEKHRCDTGVKKDGTTTRTVHQWRAVIDWTEQAVWDIIAKHRVNPHPAYQLGFGRVSCMACIFGNADQWATIQQLAPTRFYQIANYEDQFGVTIKQGANIKEQAKKGTSFLNGNDDEYRKLGMSREYPVEKMIVPEGEWTMPKGAFKRCGGPT